MDELINKISKIPLAQRAIALVGVIAVLFLAGYFIFISPIQGDIEKHEKEIKRLDSELIKKKAIAADLTRYKVEVERLKQRLNEALTLLPNEAEIPELLQKIATLVEQSDCEMEVFEPQGEVAAGFYAKIPVKMEVKGNYHSIAVFFDKISKLARIVNVTGISMGKPRTENQKVVLDAKFMATTFKFVEKKDGTKSGGTGF